MNVWPIPLFFKIPVFHDKIARTPLHEHYSTSQIGNNKICVFLKFYRLFISPFLRIVLLYDLYNIHIKSKTK